MATAAPTLTDRFDAAVAYAARAHAGQTRKGGSVPYLAHLLAVAALVLEDGGDEDEAVAALLHDTVEDAGGLARLADVRARFGARVADIVLACSDATETPKPDWCVRKRGYLAHLRSDEAGPSALRVSLADKVHNARAILADYRVLGPALWDRFSRGGDQQLWYYGALVEAYRERAPGPMADELARTVGELRELAARDGLAPASGCD